MLYPLIALGFTVLLVFYILYLFLIKKDSQKAKSVLYPGLFFIVIWVVLYFLFLR